MNEISSLKHLATRASLLKLQVGETLAGPGAYQGMRNDPNWWHGRTPKDHASMTRELFNKLPPIASTADGGTLLTHAAGSLPEDLSLFDMRPAMPNGFLFFEEPLPSGSTSVHALFWFAVPPKHVQPNERGEKGSQLLIGTVNADSPPLFGAMVWPLRRAFTLDVAVDWVGGDDRDDRVAAIDDLRLVIAFNLLLAQEVTEAEEHNPGRQARRQIERKTGHVLEPVLIVQLPRRHRHTAASTSQEVEWSHRWMVRGHWRKHWYPSEQVHKPKWIAPHIKGPDDKPYIPKDQRFVFAPAGSRE